MRSGKAHNCRITVAKTRLSMISLKYAHATIFIMPMTAEGIDNNVVSVVENPKLRRESVR